MFALASILELSTLRRFRREDGVVASPLLRLKVCEVLNVGAWFDSSIDSFLSWEVVNSILPMISGVIKAGGAFVICSSKPGKFSV